MPVVFWLQKIWLFVRKYWYVFTIIASCMLALILLRDTNVVTKLFDLLDNNRKRHDEEMSALKKAYEDELAKRDIAQKRLEQTLAQVEKQYEDSQKELDAEKRAEIKKIIQESHDDPNVLAQKLSESTGFKVVLPEQE